WIVIQQRIDGSQSFDQDWDTYKSGFGNYDANFWLGLEKMHQLTTSADYRLRFEVLVSGVWVSDEYDHFVINSEMEKYSINVSGYSGDNSDVLNNLLDLKLYQNGMKFSTPEQDNDLTNFFKCSLMHHSGFWFNACYNINMNGVYGSTLRYVLNSAGIFITSCRMMIKLNA
ncbi:hypothetical protein HELRODRAFT_81275, partial [Helobdella robusta]|uniref:Fibrinogen C-terminal domain-containing protein n=1 Tax=Helobdella robusta TaxID=6412 RepID=T1G4C4_HELRO